MNWIDAEPLLYGVGNHFSVELAKVLFDQVKRLSKRATILEIGAFYGFSTIALASACIGSHRRVITIDTFTGKVDNTDEEGEHDLFPVFWHNVYTRKVSHYVYPLIGKSERFYDLELECDLLFIDGNHQLMRQDFDGFFPKLKSGGTLLVHDVRAYHEVWQGICNEIEHPAIIGENLGIGSKP